MTNTRRQRLHQKRANAQEFYDCTNVKWYIYGIHLLYLMCVSDLIKLLLLFAHSCCLLRVIIKTFISRLGQVISIKLNQACLNKYVMVTRI